jgi:hypothetical protein
MSERADQDDLTLMLARAFDQAGKRYYLPGRGATISEEIARPSLARHLVAMAKGGVKEEDALAAGGLLHLISLTPEVPRWKEFRIEGARARFLQQWNIRIPVSARASSGV